MTDGGGLSRRDMLQAGALVAIATAGVLAAPLQRGRGDVATAATSHDARTGRGRHPQRPAPDRQVLHRRPPHAWSKPAYRVEDLLPHAPHHAIGLTIDDGPDPEWTPHVLRLLHHYGVVANFCLVGIHVRQYPHLARAIVSMGHAVVNHTYHHPQPFSTLSRKTIRGEITATQRAIHRATGVTPTLFRAPGGDWSSRVFDIIAPLGLKPLDWDVDPRDWSLPGTKEIVDDMETARPGDIVLCHDGGGDRSETVRALARVLPEWERRRLVPIRLS